METLKLIATLLPMAVTAGINLYATVLVAGLCIRMGWVAGYPPALHALGTNPVLVLAGLFFVLEFLADKIQFVDNLWDAIHTTIRPVGAALLGVAMFADVRPDLVVIGALLAGGIALASHSGKSGGRLLLNLVTPYENVTNIAISLVEDVGVGALTVVALKWPLAALAIALVLILAVLVAIPLLLRWCWCLVRALYAWLRGLVAPCDAPVLLPVAHQALLGHRVPEVALGCRAQGLRGANGRSGYLTLLDGALRFTWDGWFGASRVWSLEPADRGTVYRQQRLLVEVLSVHYRDAGRERVARFVFTRDRRPLLDRLAAALAARPAG